MQVRSLRRAVAFLVMTIACGGCSRTSGTAEARPPGAWDRARVQAIASEELARAMGQWHASRGVALVLDPRSRTILAMDGRDGAQADPTLAERHPWITGSTLKTLTLGAALEAGTITLDQLFPTGRRAYGAEELRDWRDSGMVDAAGVLAASSNVGTSYIFDTLGSARLFALLRAVHVGDPPGEVPPLADDRSLRAAELAAGEVARATPLQVAAAYAAVFEDGVYVEPGGGTNRVLSARTARALVAMLEGAVAGPGTGQAARIPGMRVAGKSGTASFQAPDGAETYYASFVGSVLDREPRFVALVGLEVPAGPATGGAAAAPAFARIAERVLGADAGGDR